MNAPSTTVVWQALKAKYGRLMEEYELHQENGQRILVFSKSKGCCKPPEGSEVFVGRLPRDLYEDELVPPFWGMGKIYEMRLMMNFSGVTRGFAFVKYFDKETARAAIRCLNHLEIRPGHKIGVLASINNRHLLVGPVLDMEPFTENDLLDLIRTETPEVERVSLHPYGSVTHFKYMLIVYATHRDAALARRILIPKKHFLFGGNCTVDWASSDILKRSTDLRSLKVHCNN